MRYLLLLGFLVRNAWCSSVIVNQVNKIDAANLNTARSVTVSPDGKNVYAVAQNSDSIVHWDRDSATGALSNQVNKIDDANLNGAMSVTVSPDGKNVYAVAQNSKSIVHWDRGNLDACGLLGGSDKCLVSNGGTLVVQADCGTSLESANRTQLETQYSSFCTE